MPPKTSTYSDDSLKGAASKPIFPGVLLKMNPKSMCIKWPSRSKRIFPLWRSLTCRRYVTMEYPRIDVGVYLSYLKTLCVPAKDLAKFRWARRNLADV